jgi:hypothetical protein
VQQFNEQQKTNASDLTNQQNEATLDEYLDDMSTLVLHDKLTNASPDSPIAAIAVARTATALRDLDGGRKGTLVRFLWETGLINGPKPTLDLYQADLDGAVFQNANLYQVYLSPLSLVGANFKDARLEGADLSQSVLIQATLEDADLTCWNHNTCTNLSGSYLIRANVAGAHLQGADLEGADLDGANLNGAQLAGTKLNNASYNVRPFRAENEQGQWVTDMPTSWPKGFNPKAAGATCDDC